jgi:hypothetical protein
MKRAAIFALSAALILAPSLFAAEAGWLDKNFAHPPPEAKLRAYWWWLNGNVTKESITRDLEEMAAKGFGGALICDANGATQEGNGPVPHGPDFFSPAWRELYKHTLREAARLGLEISLNIQSGWNLGGPMVKAEDAPKKLVWSVTRVTGPAAVDQKLPEPGHPKEFYRDVAVLAYPLNPAFPPDKLPRIKNWEEKTLTKALHFSAPDTTPLLVEDPGKSGEESLHSREVVDLTDRMQPDGTLRWNAPAGEWEILRLGCTLNDHCTVSTSSDGWQGYALDPFDAKAFTTYWNAIVEPLIADAGPLAGTTLKYLHTDSWEVEVANWTPTLREEFKKRRGYDLLPFLPALTGRIVDDRETTDRFLNDFRRTMGDLAIANHYQLFLDGAHRHGLLIHPESGGPHAVPIDSLQCLGMDDAPMSEFWARSWKHRVTDETRFFVKQPASAAHTYGHELVLAEGFTTIGPHWQETLWDNLKPTFDRAACEGLNRLVWHAFVCSPKSMGIPGQQYFAGTHLNPNVTWWEESAPFFDYLNRCQFLLQQGLFVADVLSYYGDHVPNFAQLEASDPAHVRPGYDYDVATAQVLIERLAVRDGRLVLPDGMSYRLLVMPDQPGISLPVLRKVAQLVRDGATVIGPKPARANSLTGQPQSDAEVARLADELWGSTPVAERTVGKGRVITGRTAREVLLADGVPPDFEGPPALDWIHRSAGDAEIYFVANQKEAPLAADCTFRVAGKAPELWNPVTGEIRALPGFKIADGRTTIPLEFAPYGSWFVVFRRPPAQSAGTGKKFPGFTEVQTLTGPWQVSFDPKWGGPAKIEFSELVDWTKRPESGIRHYSGKAVYRKTFDAAPGATTLDLGNVRELAAVRLNGKSLGVLWTKPFRADVRGLLKPKNNQLEIEVVNFWPNRVIGDAALPPAKRFTQTNVRELKANTPLIESGLLGPVRLLREDAAD